MAGNTNWGNFAASIRGGYSALALAYVAYAA
jgi:hypothetical protein